MASDRAVYDIAALRRIGLVLYGLPRDGVRKPLKAQSLRQPEPLLTGSASSVQGGKVDAASQFSKKQLTEKGNGSELEAVSGGTMSALKNLLGIPGVSNIQQNSHKISHNISLKKPIRAKSEAERQREQFERERQEILDRRNSDKQATPVVRFHDECDALMMDMIAENEANECASIENDEHTNRGTTADSIGWTNTTGAPGEQSFDSDIFSHEFTGTLDFEQASLDPMVTPNAGSRYKDRDSSRLQAFLERAEIPQDSPAPLASLPFLPNERENVFSEICWNSKLPSNYRESLVENMLLNPGMDDLRCAHAGDEDFKFLLPSSFITLDDECEIPEEHSYFVDHLNSVLEPNSINVNSDEPVPSQTSIIPPEREPASVLSKLGLAENNSQQEMAPKVDSTSPAASNSFSFHESMTARSVKVGSAKKPVMSASSKMQLLKIQQSKADTPNGRKGELNLNQASHPIKSGVDSNSTKLATGTKRIEVKDLFSKAKVC